SDRAWRQVSVTGSQCLGGSCPMVESCFAERSRQVAREVDLVVTNHALLAIDAFDAHGIIPEHDVVVFDEAHDLTARVTSAVTETLTPGMVRGTLRDLRGLGMAATALDDAGEELREALALAPDGRVLGDLPERLGDAVDQLRVHARTCPSDAKDAADDGTAATAREEAGEELREALALAPDGRVLGDLPERLGDAVDQLRVHARTCHSDAKDAGDDGTAGTAGARKAVRAGLQEIIDVCERLG